MIATIGVGIVSVIATMAGVLSAVVVLSSVVGLLRRDIRGEDLALNAFVATCAGLLSWCLFEVVLLVNAVRSL